MNNNPQNDSIMSLADRYMFQTYGRFPVALVRGEGCRVWDDKGKAYLDFVGGIAVCALGHSSPLVSRVLEEQSKILVHVSNLYYTRPQTELAQLLVENSFADRVFFCNSGAEANEAAIKVARRYSNEKFGPGRHVIVSMYNSFHGRTMATLSATGQSKIQVGYDPLLQGFKFVSFNDVKGLDQAMDDSVCAVILEPIQGEGGVVCPDPGYLKEVRDLCNRHNALLIFDEVQVGMGRTGRLFAHEHYGVTPDIMTLAKALGNGLPIGAMLSTEELGSVFGPGSHATTFGGTPLVTAVSKAVVEKLLEKGWMEEAGRVGEYFKGKLEGLARRYPFIKDVRGLGLILGMELDRPGTPVVEACLKEGFLVNCAHETVLRFIPPLIIQKGEIDLLVEALDTIFQKVGD
ncbi:MAG: aspartate aminotransferase family protein [Proteobacteria bacterium]|nr:aspartate aminotransferase family protein [Desulfobacterales bacterium]MBL7101745.1 aspartate aminotransferase family protein [Desulfobacteraceae bacterium]MBL7172622.1 aspartate aminotransferase family protein [Desulfobacteraceae bacterium]MBU0990109.1 aspartate aminotransferase family protein [Pseudomonadota bacterium]MBU1902495.1 aspartate aminotransferase family protein [Pseudomonadota bacterium]